MKSEVMLIFRTENGEVYEYNYDDTIAQISVSAIHDKNEQGVTTLVGRTITIYDDVNRRMEVSVNSISEMCEPVIDKSVVIMKRVGSMDNEPMYELYPTFFATVDEAKACVDYRHGIDWITHVAL